MHITFFFNSEKCNAAVRLREKPENRRLAIETESEMLFLTILEAATALGCCNFAICCRAVDKWMGLLAGLCHLPLAALASSSVPELCKR